jgi:hypothetical protein
MMTKKDFQVVADAGAAIEDDDARELIMDELGHSFRKINPRFDEDRFREWIERRVNGQSTKGLG